MMTNYHNMQWGYAAVARMLLIRPNIMEGGNYVFLEETRRLDNLGIIKIIIIILFSAITCKCSKRCTLF